MDSELIIIYQEYHYDKEYLSLEVRSGKKNNSSYIYSALVQKEGDLENRIISQAKPILFLSANYVNFVIAWFIVKYDILLEFIKHENVFCHKDSIEPYIETKFFHLVPLKNNWVQLIHQYDPEYISSWENQLMPSDDMAFYDPESVDRYNAIFSDIDEKTYYLDGKGKKSLSPKYIKVNKDIWFAINKALELPVEEERGTFNINHHYYDLGRKCEIKSLSKLTRNFLFGSDTIGHYGRNYLVRTSFQNQQVTEEENNYQDFGSSMNFSEDVSYDDNLDADQQGEDFWNQF